MGVCVCVLLFRFFAFGCSGCALPAESGKVGEKTMGCDEFGPSSSKAIELGQKIGTWHSLMPFVYVCAGG